MTRRFALLAATVLASPLVAQTPAANNYEPPATDAGRVPAAQQSNPGGSKYDGNRIPVLQGAGSGGAGGIQSFPDANPAGPIQQQPYTPQPTLNPYLNLLRGSSGSGLSAIDYYNFVRPAQQALGTYGGRPYGAAPGFGGGGRYSYTFDPETGVATSTRPVGTSASFQNYGNYFNRLGTIGSGTSGSLTAPTNSTSRR
jgi:hypothetical protein